MRPRLVALAVALLAVCVAPITSRGGPLTQDPCPGNVVGPSVWRTLGNDTLENLLFADGSLWVSDGSRSSVLRLDSNGDEVPGRSLTGVPSPGGLAEGPDGKIYVGWLDALRDSLLRTGMSKVVRFDPTAPDPNATLEVYAEGFNMANGMTFGPAPDYDLFISNDLDTGLIRIPGDDPASWSLLTDVWGTNGLVVDPAGENLYAAITFDQRSPIEQIPLAAPSTHFTAVQLSLGVLSLEPRVYTNPDLGAPLLGIKGLDDMTRDENGILYVVANGMGELLRVDPVTGQACLIASGLTTPSSVRIAPAGSPFELSGSALTFYIVEFSGAIKRVGYTPAP